MQIYWLLYAYLGADLQRILGIFLRIAQVHAKFFLCQQVKISSFSYQFLELIYESHLNTFNFYSV